jgi:hypothetical protein
MHLDADVMRDQMERLGLDMRATLERDQGRAYLKVLGRIPRDRQISRHSRVEAVKFENAPDVYVLRYKRRKICAFTAPITRPDRIYYINRWYFKIL